MPQNNSAQTEIPDGWIQQFESDISKNPTALAAWREIKRAGLEEGALYLLWGYAGGARHEIASMHRRAQYANGRIKTAIRAKKVAQAAPKRAHDSALFTYRAGDARESALKSEWATPRDGVRTLGDELNCVSDARGDEPCLPVVRNALVKTAGKRSPLASPFYFLFLLQGYAKRYGVSLGWKKLVGFAVCACSSRKLDDNKALRRYFGSIPRKDAILRDTIPTLPPPNAKQ